MFSGASPGLRSEVNFDNTSTAGVKVKTPSASAIHQEPQVPARATPWCPPERRTPSKPKLADNAVATNPARIIAARSSKYPNRFFIFAVQAKNHKLTYRRSNSPV